MSVEDLSDDLTTVSVKDVNDDLTTDSVPEPPRENSNINGHVKNDTKGNNSGKKKKEAKGKSSSSSKKKTFGKPDFLSSQPCASSTTININGANNVQLGNVINISVANQSSKTNYEKMQKPKGKPAAVSELMKNDAVVTVDDLDTTASFVGRRWKTIGNSLGFVDAQLEQIEENCIRKGYDFKEMIYQMLLEWKQDKDSKATVGTLCQILWKTEHYDAAINLARQRSSSK